MTSSQAETTQCLLRPMGMAIVVFLIIALSAATLVWRLDQLHLQEERTRVATLAQDHAHALQHNIDRTLSVTYALAAIIRQANGAFPDFEEVAKQMLLLYPGADSLQLAPGGITRQIVPPEGNEKGVGRDLLNDPLRKKEALLARDSGKLTLAGPFELIQGGVGAVGRFPVFLGDTDGAQSFWGFSSVVIRFPEILGNVLSRLPEHGYDYELWCTHPDTGEKQMITASSSSPLSAPVEQSLELPNTIWTLSVAPARGWGNPFGLLFMGSVGCLFSMLMAVLAKLLLESKSHQKILEMLVAQRTAEIRAREEEFRILAEAMPQIVWTARPDGWNTYLSPQWMAYTGLSPEQSSGQGWITPLHLDDRQRNWDAWSQAMATGTSFSTECRLRRADGVYRWWLIRGVPQSDESGKTGKWIGTCTDIHDLKQTEIALAESEARYRYLFERNPQPMWIYDSDSLAFLTVNEAAIVHYGYSREEFMVMTLRDIRADENWNLLLDNIAPIDKGLGESELWRHSKKDGSVIEVEITSHPLQFNHRRAKMVLVYDVTERRRAEEGLRLAKFCIDHASIGIFRIEQDCSIIEVNDQACRSLGYSRGELLTMSILDIDPNFSRESWLQHRKIIQAKQRGIIETHCRRKDGSIFPAEVTINYFEHAGKSFSYSFFQDTSERKRAEEKLRKLTDEFHAILNGIPDTLLHLSVDLEIRWANHGAAQRFGRPVEELIGHRCTHFASGEDEHCPNCPGLRALISGRTEDAKITGADGRSWGVKVFPLKDHNGHLTGLIEWSSDITEGLLLRAEANQASRLAALGEMAAGVAHEINNPNAVLLFNLPLVQAAFIEARGYLDGIWQERGDFDLAAIPYIEMRDELPMLLNDCVNSATRIGRIVEDIKDFIRTEQEGFVEQVLLNEVAAGAVRLAGKTLGRAPDSIQCEFDPALPPVLGCLGRLEQVAVNLLRNACQAIPDGGGEIVLATRFDRDRRLCILEVRDRGCGIPADIIPRICEPFFTTRRKEGGTGLGLSVSSRIVSEHGGRLEFTNRPGGGAVVSVLLPPCPGETGDA